MQSIFLSEEEQEIQKKAWHYILPLLFCGVIINYIGKTLAGSFSLPIYLDCIGTVFVTASGGSFPGVIVGLLSNLISLSEDSSAMYYSSLNVLVALCTAQFIKRGWLKGFFGYAALATALAFIGGGLGGIITWMLYGADSEQVSAGLAGYLYDGVFHNRLAAELGASLLLDLIDKSVTVLLVYLVFRLLPKDFPDHFRFSMWRQRPLTREAKRRVNKENCRVRSLRVKLVGILLGAGVLIVGVFAVISYNLYWEAAVSTNTRLGSSISRVAASMVDPEKVEDYISLGEKEPTYKATEDELYNLYESSEDIKYIYVYQIREDGCHVVFDLDTDEEDGAEPGEVMSFDASFEKYIDDLLAGRRIEPVVSNDRFGWLLTFYEPVDNSKGECVCYAAADISMYVLENELRRFIARMLSLLLGFFALILATSLWFTDYNITLPINTIAMTAGDFAYKTEEDREESVHKIRDLDIRTGDEIENLYHAVLKLSADTMRQLGQISEKNDKIEKMQHSLILVLADMVESRDENTGQHVRKTSAYVELIINELKREGMFVDRLTDEFIYDVINSAPLHDIGKITIPDAILNKPGRLDDNEFMIMRSHAAAGRDIISNIIDMVPDSEFLKEARNLAAHHHERWDGKGYPDGLSGEEIPLSARIMAVADVFDALVSTRSYKKGFPFEKAMDIIKEGIGTQFDPTVAEAFLKVSEEARVIAESFGEESAVLDKKV